MVTDESPRITAVVFGRNESADMGAYAISLTLYSDAWKPATDTRNTSGPSVDRGSWNTKITHTRKISALYHLELPRKKKNQRNKDCSKQNQLSCSRSSYPPNAYVVMEIITK